MNEPGNTSSGSADGLDLSAIYDLAKNPGAGYPEEPNPSYERLRLIKERYVVGDEIAVGGIKRILRVFDRKTGRDLAMATLRAELRGELLDHFIHEAWLTAKLEHPNVINIHDVGVAEDGGPYFTMDLKKGCSLREVILRLRDGDADFARQYPLEALLEIFIKVADAVSYAHSRNVLHLDLKPSNIQIGPFGEVLLCDWGLAKVIGREDDLEVDRMLLNPDLFASITPGSHMRGTPGYMAPEQIREDAHVDQRTDVFGLGCVLYAILCLKTPFDGADGDVLRQTLAGSVRDPRERNPHRFIPVGLAKVALKAIACDPAGRYPSAVELRDEVRRYLMGFATEVEQAGALRQLKLFVSRNRRLSLTVAVGAAIFLVAGAAAYLELALKEKQARAAQQQAEEALHLFQMGQLEIDRLSSDLASSVVNIARRYEFQVMRNPARDILLSALAQYPEDPVILQAMAEFKMIEQRFNEANSYFARIPPDPQVAPYHAISRRFAALKPDDDQPLGVDQFIEAILSLRMTPAWPGNPNLACRMVLLDQTWRYKLEERARIIGNFLQVLNPNWRDGWFEYDPARDALRVGGKGLRLTTSQESVLLGLQLRRLDISGSEIRSIHNEIHAPIEELRINDSPMVNRYSLERLLHLKKLHVSRWQLAEVSRMNIAEGCEIIVSD